MFHVTLVRIARFIICLTLIYDVGFSQWSELTLPQHYVPFYSVKYPCGDDCMIFAIDTSNIIYGFDQNSKTWSEYTANTTLDWVSGYGGGKVCMVLNDSIAVAYNSVHSQFNELRFEGTILPGVSGSWTPCDDYYAVIMTTERIYVYDAESNFWNSVSMLNHENLYGCSTYMDNDFMYIMMAFNDYYTRLVCYSLHTKSFDEITKYNLRFTRLNHGVCGCEYSNSLYITGYSAYTGHFTQVDITVPGETFDLSAFPTIDNDKVTELDVCMYYKRSELDEDGYVTLTVYVFNTLTGQFYSDESTYRYVSTQFLTKVGGKFAILALYDVSDYKINLKIFRTSDNSFYTRDVPLYLRGAPGLLTAGQDVFWMWDDTYLIAVNAITGAMGEITFSDSFPTTPSVMVNMAGDDWGVWGYRNAGSDTVKIFYFTGDVTDIHYREEYASLGVSSTQFNQIGYVMLQDAGNYRKWSAYSPSHNAWHDFESTTSSSDVQTIVGNYMYVNYISKSRLELFDGVTNQAHVYPHVTSYGYLKYEKDYLFAYNASKQYVGYSEIEHDDQIYQVDKYYGMTNSGYIVVINPSGTLLDTYTKIIYDGYRNNFAGLKIPDSLGTTINGWQFGKFCFFATSTGHVFAYTGEDGSIVNVKNLPDNIPVEFYLGQNYPNPFNPSTTIEFTLAERGNVKLKIYDLLGREVTTLVDGVREAGVLYKETFDASRLASGIYFYRLQTSKNSLVKKFMLVR